jgi:hypothetical protein
MEYTDEDALDMAICSAMATAEVRAEFVMGLVDRIAPRQRPGWLKVRLAGDKQRFDRDNRADDRSGEDAMRFTHHEVVDLVGLAIGKSGRALDDAIREHAQSKASQIEDAAREHSDDHHPHSYAQRLSPENALGTKHPENVL